MVKGYLNKKGFTLVELLAVIVILAILVLVAMPNVTGLMESSRKNSFNTEVQQFAKDAETAYTLSLTDSVTYGKSYKAAASGKTNTYYCISVKDLIDKGITSKQNAGDYSGIIEMVISSDGKITTYITATNGTYSYTGKTLANVAENGASKMDATTWAKGSVANKDTCSVTSTQTAADRITTLASATQ